jgi:preprotein translocase subunit SecA
MLQAGRFIALRTIDFFWQEHLELMDNVRDATRLRAYGQRDPLVEYKSEANRQFRVLLETVDANILQNLLNVTVNKNAPAASQSVRSTGASRQSAAKYAGANRNDPCPCGSGKKFKKCCGK